MPLRNMAANKTISYYFATRMGNSLRTKRRCDGATSGAELIVFFNKFKSIVIFLINLT